MDQDEGEGNFLQGWQNEMLELLKGRKATAKTTNASLVQLPQKFRVDTQTPLLNLGPSGSSTATKTTRNNKKTQTTSENGEIYCKLRAG